MKNLKKTLSALSALTIMFTAASCGKDKTEDSGNTPPQAEEVTEIITDAEGNTEVVIVEKPAEKSTDPEKDNDSQQPKTDAQGNTEAPAAAGNSSQNGNGSSNESSVQSTEALDNGSQSNSQTGGNTSSGGTQSGGNTSSGGTQSGGNTSSAGNSGGSGTGSGTGSGSAGGSATGQTPISQETTEQDDTVVYNAEISLGNSSSFTGSNVKVDGSLVKITGGGNYYIKGTLSSGQLEVNTTEKVKLYLDGVTINNPNGPAILISDAKRATIKLLSGTTTTLTDGGKDKIYDGAIFTNDTLEIKGKGTLNITANNAHGIASDDDIIIENGNINITSKKSGLFAHDDITLNDGTLTIFGGTNGMKSKNTININGGTATICGGTKEEKSSIYAAGDFSYTGGTVFAAGNMVSTPTSSTLPYTVAGFSSSVNGGTPLRITLNGSVVSEFTPKNAYKCVLMLVPTATVGSSFTISISGKDYNGSIDKTSNIFTF